jgi:hypothetical protein
MDKRLNSPNNCTGIQLGTHWFKPVDQALLVDKLENLLP